MCLSHKTPNSNLQSNLLIHIGGKSRCESNEKEKILEMKETRMIRGKSYDNRAPS